MYFILFAVGLGYLQVGSNMLQRDMSGAAMNRPLYMSSGASLFQHYAFTILLWPLIRLARCPRGSSLLRTLGYCAIELGFMAVTSAVLMAVSLFTGNVAAQALYVLGLYAFVLARGLRRITKPRPAAIVGRKDAAAGRHSRTGDARRNYACLPCGHD